MKSDKELKYVCLFGGGAIRGAAHVGVLKALEQFNIKPTIYGGSSVGSIIAALCAVGYTTEELKDIFLSVNFELFRDISIGFTRKFALSKGRVFLDWLRELIEKKFYAQDYEQGKNPPVRFKDIKEKLVIMTTNMNDFNCFEFSTFETPEFEIAMAVRISCCMPGLMRAISMDDKLLVDGDLLKGRPMWSLSKNLKDNPNRILEIRLEGEFSGSDTQPLDYVNGMYSCMTNCETSFIQELYGECDKYDYLVINTGDVIVVDFNYPNDKRQAIIDSGYSQTMEYFSKKLPQKKQTLNKIYEKILIYLKKNQNFLRRRKYNSMKNGIGELFIYLSEVGRIIDPELYTKISEYQKLLFLNVKSGLLGQTRCENRNLISEKLEELVRITTGLSSNMEIEYKFLFDNN